LSLLFFFDTCLPPVLYPLSLHDALPIWLQRQLDRIVAEPTDADIWRSVELARHPDRPYTLDYVERMLEDFVELHGDRGRADDARSEEHTSELQTRGHLVCRLLLEKKKKK